MRPSGRRRQHRHNRAQAGGGAAAQTGRRARPSREERACDRPSSRCAHDGYASSSMEHFVAALDGRIRSMGSTHELLSHRRWLGIPLRELVQRELAPYATGSNAEIGGPEAMLRAEAGQTMGMVLHECVTNAAKYGALSASSGRVSSGWRLQFNGPA